MIRKTTSATAPTPRRGDYRYEQEFVYDNGEALGKRASDRLVKSAAEDDTAFVSEVEFMPLTAMQHATSPARLQEVRVRLKKLARAEVIERYRTAYITGKRLVAGVMAAELITRGVPPCFWHEALVPDDVDVDRRADLMLADLAWVRCWYPEHAKAVRYQRGKALLTGSEAVFRREAAFAFYNGKRPAWKIVGSMSMTERQQWEVAVLRSTPIRKRAKLTDLLSERVWQALSDDLQMKRRTAAFTNADATDSLFRRHRLWCCARTVKGGSPTEIAVRYQQMTGKPISRQAVAKQLLKVNAVLHAKGLDY